MLLARASQLGSICLILIAEAPAAFADEPEPRQISVTASGYVTSRPDTASVTVGVVTENKAAKVALEENSKRIADVLAGIKRLGIAPQDIATDRFSVSPVYERRKSSQGYNRQQIAGFRVTNNMIVTIRKIDLAGDVIDRAAELGANKIGNIDFLVSGLELKLDQARRRAMRNAIRRAQLYAQAAGATLGAVLRISEQFHGRRPRPAAGGARLAASVPIEPGQHRIGVTVNASWELR